MKFKRTLGIVLVLSCCYLSFPTYNFSLFTLQCCGIFPIKSISLSFIGEDLSRPLVTVSVIRDFLYCFSSSICFSISAIILSISPHLIEPEGVEKSIANNSFLWYH